MKKLLFVLLALTLCVTFLTACKKDEPDTEDDPIVDSGDNNPSDDNQNDDNQSDDNQNDDNQNDDNKEDIVYSEGLAFTSNGDGTCSVSGIGTCADTDVVIPPTSPDGDSVTGIGNYAFYGCNSILSITVPESVTMLGDYSISGNQLLEKVVMSNNVKTLGNGVFSFNPSLEQLEIPNSVISVGNYLIDSCALLERAKYDSGYYYGNKNNPFLLLLGGASSGETMITVHNDTKIIADFALFGRKDLNAIVIHTGVTAIGNYVFSGCENLTHIYYIGNAEDWAQVTVGDYNEELTNATRYYYSETQPTTDGNFWHYVEGVPTVWENITEETYSEGLAFTSNGDGTCYVSGIGTCTDTDIVIPTTSPDGDKVIGIGNSAFSGCDNLTSIVIPDSVTSIGWSAFSNCSSLTDVTIPDSVTSIGNYAFDSCTGLASITIPDINVSIGAYAFYGTAYYNDESNWENGVLYIGKHLIVAKTDMSNIYVVKDGTLDIASEAFFGCRSLTGVEIPDSVTSIGEWAFSGCYGLTSIVIPDGVTSIGERAFSNCSSLTSIVISDGLKHIGEIAFYGCDSLTSITVDENNQNYKSVDDNLYSKDGKTLVAYAPGKTDTDFVIPDGVTCIGNYAFCNCRSLASIVIPDSVTSIGNHAFSGCFRFTSIVIPDSVTSIGNYAFSDCSGLTSMVIPDGVTSIGDSAFSGCDRLTSIVIPDSVTSIGKGVFNSCNSFTDVYYKGSEADWAEISIGISNSYLTGATIHYNYTE